MQENSFLPQLIGQMAAFQCLLDFSLLHWADETSACDLLCALSTFTQQKLKSGINEF